MHRVGILAGLVCLAANLVCATSVCVPGTLEDYIQLGPGGCSVDNLMFSNFQFTAAPSFTTAPDPMAIMVSPDRTPILANFLIGAGGGSGLDFGFNHALLPQPNAATQDFTTPSLVMTVSFDVASPTGLGRVAMAPQLTADPMATAAASLTVGSAPCATADASQGLPGPSGCALGGAAKAQVVESIRLITAPEAGAGAEVKSVATRWTEFGIAGGSGGGPDSSAPEPGTWMLLGLGMGLVALGQRHGRRS